MSIPGFLPAVVESYDDQARTVRISIPGLTDGAEVFPEAVLAQAIGDKSEHTEVRILPGDRVWVTFINGDPRFPVVTHYRAMETGNDTGWRRWHHANVEINALTGDVHVISARDVIVDSARDVTVSAGRNVHVTATDVRITATGAIALESPTLTHNGTNVGSTHVHHGVKRDIADTDGPH